MIESLKSMFETQARTERFNVWQSLMDCKLKEGDPMSPHVIKMIGYVQALDHLGFPLLDELATDVVWDLFRLATGRSFRTIICMEWIRSSLNCMGCSKWQSRILRKARIKC